MEISKKISVITVTYNAGNVIEKTLKSILSQSYQNIELIIIDGKSSDNTIDIIKKYQDGISTLISEKDEGIYDAMNKGIDLATGEFIIYMNAGDTFYDDTVVSSIAKTITDVPDCVVGYGSTLIHYPFGDYIVDPDSPSELERCMPFCHQSVFVKADVIKKFKFQNNLKIAGDHNQLLRIFRNFPDRFLRYNGVVSVYEAITGVSARHTLQGYKESKKFATTPDSLFRKIRIGMRTVLPNTILNPFFRVFFYFNPRYHKM